MKIFYDVASNVGAVRTNNEDMAYVFGSFIRDNAECSMVKASDSIRFAALVADGLGGYAGGEVASEMALKSFDRFISSFPDGADTIDVIIATKLWFSSANSEIMQLADSNPNLFQMGTTLTGLFTYGDDAFLINAGDSRVYRRRGDFLRQLSTDHSERERLNDPSLPSNLIYNSLGIPDAFIDVTSFRESFPIIDGDTYLICSDGLHDMISDDEINEILAGGGDAEKLIGAAIAAGGRDNCTVIILRISV